MRRKQKFTFLRIISLIELCGVMVSLMWRILPCDNVFSLMNNEVSTVGHRMLTQPCLLKVRVDFVRPTTTASQFRKEERTQEPKNVKSPLAKKIRELHSDPFRGLFIVNAQLCEAYSKLAYY